MVAALRRHALRIAGGREHGGRGRKQAASALRRPTRFPPKSAMQRRHTDPENASRPRTLRQSATPVAAACAWLAAVIGGGVWEPLAPLANPLAAAGQAVLGVLALHAFHEGGHVLAGLAVGAPLQSVTLGVLTVYRERRGGTGRFRCSVNRSWRRFAGCVEREITPAPGLQVALTVTALAGPVASLAGGAVLLAAPGSWSSVGLASILIGVLNALPIKVLGQASDGMIVRRLWGGRAADVAWRTELGVVPLTAATPSHG
jgi:hypothetical protein